MISLAKSQQKPVTIHDQFPNLKMKFTNVENVLISSAEHAHPAPLRFIEFVHSKTAVRLKRPRNSKSKLYHLLFCRDTLSFFVSSSLIEAATEKETLVTLTRIYGLREFENAHGQVETKHLLRSAKKAFTKSERPQYEAWRHGFLIKHDPGFYQELRLRKVYVSIVCEKNEDSKDVFNMGKPDVPDSFLLSEGFASASHHPNFWIWFGDAAKARGEKFMVNIERATGIFLNYIDSTQVSLPVYFESPSSATACQ